MRRYAYYLAAATVCAAALCATACSTDDISQTGTTQETRQRARVRLVCTTPAAASVSARRAPITRAALAANGKALTDIYIMDYDKTTGTLLQVLHQTATAQDFAEPDLLLDYGEHTLKVVATRSDSPTLQTAAGTVWTTTDNTMVDVPASADAPVLLASDKTSDTFGAEADVTVGTGTSEAVSITLERLVAKLVIKATDTFPADCTTLDVVLDEYTTLSWATLSVIERVKNHRITDVSSLAGKTGTTVSYFALCPADGYTTDVTVTPGSSSGTDYTAVSVTGVPLDRNKVTTITGTLYGHTRGLAIQVADAWSEEGHDISL